MVPRTADESALVNPRERGTLNRGCGPPNFVPFSWFKKIISAYQRPSVVESSPSDFDPDPDSDFDFERGSARPVRSSSFTRIHPQASADAASEPWFRGRPMNRPWRIRVNAELRTGVVAPKNFVAFRVFRGSKKIISAYQSSSVVELFPIDFDPDPDSDFDFERGSARPVRSSSFTRIHPQASADAASEPRFRGRPMNRPW